VLRLLRTVGVVNIWGMINKDKYLYVEAMITLSPIHEKKDKGVRVCKKNLQVMRRHKGIKKKEESVVKCMAHVRQKPMRKSYRLAK